MARKQTKKSLGKLNRRMKDRAVAARTVIPFLKEAAEAPQRDAISKLDRLSLNQVAGLVLEVSGQGEPANLESRLWNPSRPVFHLAAAFEIVRHAMQKVAGIALDYKHLLWDLDTSAAFSNKQKALSPCFFMPPKNTASAENEWRSAQSGRHAAPHDVQILEQFFETERLNSLFIRENTGNFIERGRSKAKGA